MKNPNIVNGDFVSGKKDAANLIAHITGELNSLVKNNPSYQTIMMGIETELVQNNFVYGNLKKRGESFKLKARPEEGQVAFFNLTSGYPGELTGPHWCYVIKDVGCKMFVVPMTSVKATMLNEGMEADRFHFFIDVYDDTSKTPARVSLTDARWVDVGRLDCRRSFRTSSTTQEEMLKRTTQLISGEDNRD